MIDDEDYPVEDDEDRPVRHDNPDGSYYVWRGTAGQPSLGGAPLFFLALASGLWWLLVDPPIGFLPWFGIWQAASRS
jgi:hypothetical protein